MTSEAETPTASTLGGEILAGMLGAGVAVACIVPPVVHLVAGPIGPLIGGFIAASRAKPGARGKAIIALIVGSGVAGVLGAAAFTLLSFAGRGELPSWFPSKGALAGIVAGVWCYGVVLAAIGTAISGAFAERKAASTGS